MLRPRARGLSLVAASHLVAASKSCRFLFAVLSHRAPATAGIQRFCGKGCRVVDLPHHPAQQLVRVNETICRT